MAERGAHLTSANVNVERPTIFEVLAQDSLHSTIRPAVKHAVKVLAENRPDRFGWMLQFFDEVYTIFELIVQNYYLSTYGGSFAENFYELRRIVSSSKSSILSKSLKWKSIVCLVVFPYLKLKLDQLFEDLRHKSHFTGKPKDLRGCLTKSFLGVYPYVNLIWEGSNLWYQLAYMFGQSNWHSWLLKRSGTELRRLNEFDIIQKSRPVIAWQNRSFQQKWMFILNKIMDISAVSLSTGVSVGVFFLQFLQWWYQSEDKAVSLTSLPIPDPPQVDDNKGISEHKCPLCDQVRQNETALSVSGYVFCFRCITGYINQHGCCPVTHYPATTDHLVKIYPPDT